MASNIQSLIKIAKFGDNWAIAHRNWRGIFAAIGLSIVLIWSLALKKQEDGRIFLQTEKIIATVHDVKKTETDDRFGNKNTTYFVHLTLPEGKTIRFMLLQPPPEIGSQVPVLVDIYDDGKNYYHYNQIDWQLLPIQ